MQKAEKPTPSLKTNPRSDEECADSKLDDIHMQDSEAIITGTPRLV